MTRKIWRYTHLLVAFIIFIYLLIASISGAILGIHEGISAKQNQADISVASFVEKVSKNYAEVVSLKKNKEGEIELQAYDEEYNEIKGTVDPTTGKIITLKKQKNQYIDWVTTLHRSLFLDTTGRVLAGIFTVLFLIELITGALYMARAVPSFRYLFTQWKYENFALTYHHSVSRIVFFPLLILGITGAILFLFRFNILEEKLPISQQFDIKQGKEIPVYNFPILTENSLKDFISLQFPFDESEGYYLETNAGKYELDFSTGQIISQEVPHPSVKWKALSYDLHTGKVHYIWAWVISLASLSVPGFVITGFMLFSKRKAKTIANNAKPEEAKIVVLYGSENGSTRQLAYEYTKKINKNGKVFLGTMNELTEFPKAQKMFIFTATYGNGEAPTSADEFIKKLQNVNILPNIQLAILGFGSMKYDLYNQFSKDVVKAFKDKGLGNNISVFEKINERNPKEIAIALQKIKNNLNISIDELETMFSENEEKYQTLKILEKSSISEKNQYCQIVVEGKEIFFSDGDLLKVKIPHTEDFRYYSIAKKGKNISLFTKYIIGGKCSEYFKELSVGNSIEAVVVHNQNFHIDDKPTIMISNGTGIAPYLGLLTDSDRKDLILYAGFRHREKELEELKNAISKNEHHWCYSSQEDDGQRITQLVNRDIDKIVKHLMQNNTVMICGALSLKKEVENLLNQAFKTQNIPLNTEDLYLNNILKADCY